MNKTKETPQQTFIVVMLFLFAGFLLGVGVGGGVFDKKVVTLDLPAAYLDKNELYFDCWVDETGHWCMENHYSFTSRGTAYLVSSRRVQFDRAIHYPPRKWEKLYPCAGEFYDTNDGLKIYPEDYNGDC